MIYVSFTEVCVEIEIIIHFMILSNGYILYSIEIYKF